MGVVNVDDAHGRRLGIARVGADRHLLRRRGAPQADWRAVDVRLGTEGRTFQVVGPGGVEAAVTITLPGLFNVANALGAIVALVEAGVDLADAVAGRGHLPGVPGRMQRVPQPD